MHILKMKQIFSKLQSNIFTVIYFFYLFIYYLFKRALWFYSVQISPLSTTNCKLWKSKENSETILYFLSYPYRIFGKHKNVYLLHDNSSIFLCICKYKLKVIGNFLSWMITMKWKLYYFLYNSWTWILAWKYE